MNTKLTLSILFGAQVMARAVTYEYVATLDGPSEASPNNSPGIGSALVTYDDVAHTLQVHVAFGDLVGTTTASHIHGPTAVPLTGTAGVATTVPTFAGFPLGVHSGTYDNTLDLTQTSSYNPAFLNAHGADVGLSETALADAIAAGKSYLNIHTSVFPGGEIRGFLTPVPDGGGTAVLLGVAVLGLVAGRRKGGV